MTIVEKKDIVIPLLFLCGVFFPYIELVPIGVDTQPHALLLSVVIVFLSKSKGVPKATVILFFPLFLSLIFMLISGASMNALRSLGNYVSLFFIVWGTIIFLRNGGCKIFLKYFPYFVYAWFFVGFVQFLGWDNFGTSLLPRAIGSNLAGRGVVGLAPEPTFYGVTCLFMLFFALEIKNKSLVVSLLIQIVLFSRSSMSILLLVLLAGLYFISLSNVKKMKSIAMIPLFLLAAYPLMHSDAIQDSRVYILADRFVQAPGEILNEGSVYHRWKHIEISLIETFNNNGFPHGFYKPIGISRIMSGYGAVLYEMGVVGLTIILLPLFVFRKYYKNSFGLFFMWGTFFTALMFTATPIAFPMFGFMLGFLIYFSGYTRHVVALK